MYAKLRNNLVQAQNINWMVSVSRMARKGGCGDNDEKKFPDQDKVHVRCVIWVEWKERRKKLLATESLGMRSRIFDSANSYQHTSRREILVCECISKHFAHCAGQKQTNEKREKWEPTKKKETGLRWNFVGSRWCSSSWTMIYIRFGYSRNTPNHGRSSADFVYIQQCSITSIKLHTIHTNTRGSNNSARRMHCVHKKCIASIQNWRVDERNGKLSALTINSQLFFADYCCMRKEYTAARLI